MRKWIIFSFVIISLLIAGSANAEKMLDQYWKFGEYRPELSQENKNHVDTLLKQIDTASKGTIIRENFEAESVERQYEEYLRMIQNGLSASAITYDDFGPYVWAVGLPDTQSITLEEAKYISYLVLLNELHLSEEEVIQLYPQFSYETGNPEQPVWRIFLMPYDQEVLEENTTYYDILIYAHDGSLCGYNAVKPAPEDEPLQWSEPGKYLTDALAPQREIRDEKEAEAYAEELWSLLCSAPLPEGFTKMDMDLSDGSYHFVICDSNGLSLYNANFLSNGLVQQIGYDDRDPRRYTDGMYTVQYDLDAKTWIQVQKLLFDQLEKLEPGIWDLVQPPVVHQIIDVTDKKYLIISALPLDTDYKTGIHIVAILYPDGRCMIMDFSCYGAG